MNKKYKWLSFILIIGYGFFFTTRLWNIDDRPRFNSWENLTINNNQGRIAINEVVYVSQLDALDIIIEQTSFIPNRDIELKAIVHRLDGSKDVVPVIFMNEATHMNRSRQFVRVYLEKENLDWHFIEIAFIDEMANSRSSLTVDWRLIRRTDEITTIASYDLNFDEIMMASEGNHTHIHNHGHQDHDAHDHEGCHHDHDLSLTALEQSLDDAFNEYAIVSQFLEMDPDDSIWQQSLEFYESEILRIQGLIEEYHYETN